MQENGLIRNRRKIAKFMMSQAGTQTFIINIFPDISKSEDNQTIKFGQLIYYNVRNNCHAENKTKNLVPNLFLFLKELYM